MYIEFPKTDLIGCKYPENTGRNGELIVATGAKEYVYRVLPGMEEINIGDMVVVSSSSGFGVCIVTALDKTLPPSIKEVAYVVGKVDFQKYQEILEAKKRKELLRTQLMKKKKELDEKFALDLYAEKDPEFKAMLEAYNSL